MPHPEIDNRTPFSFEALFVTDEDGRPILVPIVKATFDVSPAGGVAVADEQRAIDYEGKAYGDPAASSYRFEPETAFFKPGTDIVLVGHAHAPEPGTTYVDVEFRVGQLGKWVRAWGDRFSTGGRGSGVSDPVPFEIMPLTYERAFGGWDRTADDPAHHGYEPRNPVGVGFRTKHGKVVEGDPWPNLEDPYDPVRGLGPQGKPTGFGFTSSNWEPRVSLAGTYDAQWEEQRAPLLPFDFDRRFFNAASEGMVATPYLHGNEPVAVRQATPEGYWTFELPGVAHPRCAISTKSGRDQTLETNLDTVVVDSDARQLTLVWRTFTRVRKGPLDVTGIVITSANMTTSEGGSDGAPEGGF